MTDAELDALAEHFGDYVAGPGYDVLRAVAELREMRQALRRIDFADSLDEAAAIATSALGDDSRT